MKAPPLPLPRREGSRMLLLLSFLSVFTTKHYQYNMFAVHFTPLPTGEGQGVGLFLCLILFVLQVRISR